MQLTPLFCSALTLYIEMQREKMTMTEKTRTNVITNARYVYTYKQHAMDRLHH
jgi:hypothetical protein